MKAAGRYQKGARYEREIVNRAKALGHTAFRSAGSHSPIDVVIIDDKQKHIHLVQCKNWAKDMSQATKDKLLEPLKDLNGIYSCTVELL